MRQEPGRKPEPHPEASPYPRVKLQISPAQAGPPPQPRVLVCCPTLCPRQNLLLPGLCACQSPPGGPPPHSPPPLRNSSDNTVDSRPGKSQGSFQEILFLESPLTFGLGLAPRLHCFVLGCFYCYSLKNLEPGCPGALAPPWAGPVSLWAEAWPGGGVGGGRGEAGQKGTSLPETKEGGRGVPARKT